MYGDFIYNDQIIDEVVLSYFEKDKSFTGQETIEISAMVPHIFKKLLLKNY